jgi:hypothetical protein
MVFRVSCFVALFLGLTAAVHAHALKLSVTEATYNRDTGRLELAVRLFADDFEEALTKDAGRRVPVDKPELLTPAADAYLRKHFKVTAASGEAQQLVWSGVEVTATHVWLYADVALPGGLIGATFSVTFMHELFSDQLNSLQLRDGDFKQALIFVGGTGAVTVRPKR